MQIMPNLTPNYSFNLPLVNNATDADLWGGQLNSNWSSLDTLLLTASNATAPIGSIVDYGGTSAPSLWLLCYGQAIDRTTYASLFTAIGTTYGVGDGSTTFNVPDARGRVSAGKDDMGGSSANRLTNQSGGVNGDTLGGTGGAETHALTSAENGAHQHKMFAPTANNSQTRPSASDYVTVEGSAANDSAYIMTESASSGTEAPTLGLTESVGSGSAHNNVQPTIIFNKIIYAGV